MEKFPDKGYRVEQMRAMLGKFGLSGHHHLQPIVKLSGGQKARVVFAAVSLSNPHILLLDEPTNHLDMESIDALADAIADFDGGVVIISHDAKVSHACVRACVRACVPSHSPILPFSIPSPSLGHSLIFSFLVGSSWSGYARTRRDQRCGS